MIESDNPEKKTAQALSALEQDGQDLEALVTDEDNTASKLSKLTELFTARIAGKLSAKELVVKTKNNPV